MVAESRRAMTFMSTDDRRCWLCLKISLMQRFRRLRITAQPTFLLTVIPKRACASSLTCQTNKKPLTVILSVEPDSLKKSARFRKRRDLGNVLSRLASPAIQELLGCNAYRKVLAPLGPSALDNKTTVLGGHPYQKTMCTFTGSITWLKCSFHINTPNKILQEMSY